MTDGAPSASKLPFEPNVNGAITYAPCCIGLFFSIFVMIVEKADRAVRFHASQSLVLHAICFVVGFAFNIFVAILPGFFGAIASLLGLLWVPVGLGFLVLLFVLMAKAYGGETWRLPVVADLADKWV